MGPNFYGIYQISINSSGQFNVPTEQLDVLRVLTEESGARLWVTRDVDDECLTIYRHDEWSVIRKKIQQLQNFTKEFRRISRRMIGNSKQVSIDAAGRILIPKELRNRCQLKTRALFVGNGDRIEIWDRDLFEKAEQRFDEDKLEFPDKYDKYLKKV